MPTLFEHIQTPDSRRDQSWERKLFKYLLDSKVTLLSDASQTGPDGLPYLLVEIKPDSQEPFLDVLRWLSDKGIGLVINPNKAFPDYIFSYGMIWNFRERGEFLTDAPIQTSKEFALSNDQQVHAGSPHPQYFPDYVRAHLKDFFVHQGVFRPRFLVIGQNNHYDLCFSIESLGNPPQEEHAGVLSALSWFFPQHYSLALVSEKDLMSFIDL